MKHPARHPLAFFSYERPETTFVSYCSTYTSFAVVFGIDTSVVLLAESFEDTPTSSYIPCYLSSIAICFSLFLLSSQPRIIQRHFYVPMGACLDCERTRFWVIACICCDGDTISRPRTCWPGACDRRLVARASDLSSARQSLSSSPPTRVADIIIRHRFQTSGGTSFCMLLPRYGTQ